MISTWDYGDEVRVIRNIRDDGTFPGAHRGDLLVRRGSVGCIVDKGTFLMDQIIYSVMFPTENRTVGCREEELIGQEEPWIESQFESRERVTAAITLVTKSGLQIAPGAHGEVIRVLRDESSGPAYHVHFDCLPGTLLLIKEASLAPATFPEG